MIQKDVENVSSHPNTYSFGYQLLKILKILQYLVFIIIIQKALYLCKLARKQKEILYQGNECQNIFTCSTYMRQSYGNIVVSFAMQVDISKNASAREIKIYRILYKFPNIYTTENIEAWLFMTQIFFKFKFNTFSIFSL